MLSCASSDTSQSSVTEPIFEAELPEGVAPPPYTAREIARVHPAGTFTLYRLSGEGSPTMLQRTEWVASTAEGCTIAVTAISPDGGTLGETESRSAQWWQLRNHAVFPEEAVRISDDRVAIEAGEFDCALYEVDTPGEAGEGGRMRMWFDKQSAGSPVLFTSEVGGRIVSRMELVETNRRSL